MTYLDYIHTLRADFRLVVGKIACVSVLFSCAVSLPVAATDSDSPEQTMLSDRGVYRVTIRPESGTVPVAKMHSWIVHVESETGLAFVPTQLVFMAGMPLHGHGLPSAPKATRYLENGDFLIEGVKFNMTGLWNIVVNVTGPAGPDETRFDMNLRNAPVELGEEPDEWTDDELRTMNSLWLNSLDPVPLDVTNRLSGNKQAAALGQQLYFDRGLSAPGKVSCADCHDPAKYFTDGRVRSFGSRQTARHSPTIIGAAYGQWFYWDGRRDSLWSQAVTPIETPGEMDNTRVDAVRYVMTHEAYGPLFAKFSDRLKLSEIEDFDRFPAGAGPYAGSIGKQRWLKMAPADKYAIGQAYADIGKVLAAYVETVLPTASRFDRFVDALFNGDQKTANTIMTAEERAGLKLFLDVDQIPCLRCHNGPLFSNQEFHNIGTGYAEDESFDFGRYIGLQAAMVDEFNCRGPFSNASREQCDRLKHVTEGHADAGAFKVPSLRNVAATPPYMHDGRFGNLGQVIEHYRNPPPASDIVHEIPAFQLTENEAAYLTAFLVSLTSLEGMPASN